MANTIASNAIFHAGVTSKTTLIAVKVCSHIVGGCPFASIFFGLIHAYLVGADVVNMSLGATLNISDDPDFVALWEAYFALFNSLGMTIVVSAGNDAINLDTNSPDSYKAFCDSTGVICVSATGPLSSASSTGPYYHIGEFAQTEGNTENFCKYLLGGK